MVETDEDEKSEREEKKLLFSTFLMLFLKNRFSSFIVLTEPFYNGILQKERNPSKLIGIKIIGINHSEEGDHLKLSTKGRYGLRAMIDLAKYSEGEPVSITSISDRQGISERYLEQLMGLLKKSGLVKSIRGAGGGYMLAKDLKDISVGDVLRALEGNLELVDCPGLLPQEGCKSADSCVTKYVWKRINDSIHQTVEEIKLDQLVEESCRMNYDTEERINCES